MRARVAVIAMFVAAGCGAQGEDIAPGNPALTVGAAPSAGGPGAASGEGGPTFVVDGGAAQHPATSPSGAIYANTVTELYRFDPATRQLSLVAPFTGCSGPAGSTMVWDLGIDALGNCYATTSVGLWKVDLQTAVCTKIADGSVGNYPPSEGLTFVPKGTLDPSKETLVGYVSGGSNPPSTTDPYWNSTYTSVSTSPYGLSYSGTVGWEDIFDVVSVINGGTFAIGHVSAYSADCRENCLLQIDPVTGSELQHYAPVTDQEAIDGLAYWAGVVYAFGNQGGVYSMSWSGNAMTVTKVPVEPSNLHFMGAASTTAAPAKSPDGKSPPIK